MDPSTPSRFGRARIRGWQLTRCAVQHWFADSASTTGAALAFFCAFSLAPLLVIIITLTGYIVGEASAYGFLSAQLDLLFGHSTAQILLDAIHDSQHSEGRLATLVSIGTLLIGATTVLAALDEALERIWGGAPKTQSTVLAWLRTRVLSLAFILTLSFLLLVSLTVSTAIAGLRSWTAERYAPLVGAVSGADLLVSIALTTSLFALIYRYMPARRLPWKQVLGGGLFTAVLFSAGKWAVGWYLAQSTQPTAFGAAASFAALLLWLYYTAQILLLGAEFTACLGGLRDEPREVPAGAGRDALGSATAPSRP